MGIQIRNAKKRVGTIEEKKRKFLMAQWTDDEKEKRYRELEVVVLKNRGGEIKNGNDGGVKTTFDAKLSRFSEYGFGED
jgi:replicative DNA helicase